MANDLVVQLGAELDRFSKDVVQAGDIADVAIDRMRMTIDDVTYVGGLAALISIDAHSVIQRIVHRWEEDEPGKKVVPRH